MPLYDWNQIKAQDITELYSRKIALGEEMSVARLEASQGSTTRSHAHEHEEIIVLLKGCWRFHFAGNEVVLHPNQVLTIPAGVEHSSEVVENVVAIDVCSSPRKDWLHEEDRSLHSDPDQMLWGV